MQCIDGVKIEWFTRTARFLDAVKDGNRGNSGRKCLYKTLNIEWTEETCVDDTDFFPLLVEIFHGFTGSLNSRTHQNNNSFSIRCTVVFIEVIVAACERPKFLHHLFSDFRAGIIVTVDRLSPLEIDVGIL